MPYRDEKVIPFAAQCKVSVITPAYNQPLALAQQLDAFRAGIVKPPQLEFIIWDNSPNGRFQGLAQASDVRVFGGTGQNMPFAAANNLAAQHATGDVLLFANDDIVPCHDMVAKMLKVMGIMGAGIVGAKLLYPNGLVQHAGVGFDYNLNPWHLWRFALADYPPANRTSTVLAVTGACMMVRADVFRALEGFDETFEWSYEDVDFCLRCREAGLSVFYSHEAVAVHAEGLTRGQVHENDQRNWEYFTQKWFRSGRFFPVVGIWGVQV